MDEISAYMDLSTMKCVCDNQTTIQSNISGFCYPITEPGITINCSPNPNGIGCRYGVDLFENSDRNKPIAFLNNGRFYISNKSSTENSQSKLMDITDFVNSNPIDKSKFIDITNSIFKDAFYSYKLSPISDYSPLKGDLLSDINNLLGDTTVQSNICDSTSAVTPISLMLNRLNNIAIAASKRDGLAKLCNSYYYRRDGYPNCEDPLNKTGSEAIFNNDFDKIFCGTSSAKKNIDIYNYPYGYHCNCCGQGRKVSDNSGYDLIDKIGEVPYLCDICTTNGNDSNDKTGKDCCIARFDINGNQVSNILGYKSAGHNLGQGWNLPGKDYGWFKPDYLCKSGWTSFEDNLCCLQANDKCSSDAQCASGACGHMDGDDLICCPYGSLIPATGYYTVDWCDRLRSGDKCKHDMQCLSGDCKDGRCK
jgi:hypothetical protein